LPCFDQAELGRIAIPFRGSVTVRVLVVPPRFSPGLEQERLVIVAVGRNLIGRTRVHQSLTVTLGEGIA
jgi:hypothetical protein